MQASALRADGAAGWVRAVSGGRPPRSGQSDVEFLHVLLAERVRDVGPQPVVNAFVIGERVVLVVGPQLLLAVVVDRDRPLRRQPRVGLLAAADLAALERDVVFPLAVVELHPLVAVSVDLLHCLLPFQFDAQRGLADRADIRIGQPGLHLGGERIGQVDGHFHGLAPCRYTTEVYTDIRPSCMYNGSQPGRGMTSASAWGNISALGGTRTGTPDLLIRSDLHAHALPACSGADLLKY